MLRLSIIIAELMDRVTLRQVFLDRKFLMVPATGGDCRYGSHHTTPCRRAVSLSLYFILYTNVFLQFFYAVPLSFYIVVPSFAMNAHQRDSRQFGYFLMGKWIGKPLYAVRQERRHGGAALLPIGHDHRHDVVKVARVVGMDEVAQLVEHDVVDDFLRHDG